MHPVVPILKLDYSIKPPIFLYYIILTSLYIIVTMEYEDKKIEYDMNNEILKLQIHINKLKRDLENIKSDYLSLKNKLSFFYRTYQDRIGKLYLELDRLKLKFAKIQLDNSLNQKNDDFIKHHIKESLFEKEMELNKIEDEISSNLSDDEDIEEVPEDLTPKSDDKIKIIYRKLASRFHPDKARSEQERIIFHNLMSEINLAYDQLDIRKLQELVEALGCENDDSLASQIKILRNKIVSLNNEIEEVNIKIQELKSLNIYNLYKKVDEMLEYGIDLLSKIESSILLEINKYNKKLKNLGKIDS